MACVNVKKCPWKQRVAWCVIQDAGGGVMGWLLLQTTCPMRTMKTSSSRVLGCTLSASLPTGPRMP